MVSLTNMLLLIASTALMGGFAHAGPARGARRSKNLRQLKKGKDKETEVVGQSTLELEGDAKKAAKEAEKAAKKKVKEAAKKDATDADGTKNGEVGCTEPGCRAFGDNVGQLTDAEREALFTCVFPRKGDEWAVGSDKWNEKWINHADGEGWYEKAGDKPIRKNGGWSCENDSFCCKRFQFPICVDATSMDHAGPCLCPFDETYGTEVWFGANVAFLNPAWVAPDANEGGAISFGDALQSANITVANTTTTTTTPP